MNWLERMTMKTWVDNWMQTNYGYSMPWTVFEKYEGGHGAQRCRTIKDAMSREGSYPAIWFMSDQTDLSVYGESRYIYSLMWAAYKFSGNAYTKAFEIWPSLKDRVIIDVGGSLFTALECLKHTNDRVYVYNMVGTPQTKMITDYAYEFGLPIYVTDDYKYAEIMGDVFFFKAYLEHFKVVEEELGYWVLSDEARVKRYVFVNSFCEIAYGHYIPITIDGRQYDQQDNADEAFVHMMRDRYNFSEPQTTAVSSKKLMYYYSN